MSAQAPGEPILLAGGSVRMLAELAVAGGHQVIALDHFGDRDTRRLCPWLAPAGPRAETSMAEALVAAAESVAAPSAVYAASFENHPELVARLGRGRRLLGNPPEALRRVRDPGRLGAALQDGGFPFPETVAGDRPPRLEGSRRWLRKPLRGGGGRGVRRWRGESPPPGTVLQELIVGLPCSAALVGDGGRAALLGLSEQLIGRPALGAGGYRWCGNLAPPRLPGEQRRALAEQARALGDHLARAFGLRGLFGIDLIWDSKRAWTVEVNPRPTAALEVLAAVYGMRPFEAHLAAFTGPPQSPLGARPAGLVERGAAGKAILYAPQDLAIGDTGDWWDRGRRDVPHPGQRIARGRPVCTLLASAATPDACLRALEARAAALRAELRAPALPDGPRPAVPV